MNKIFCVSAGQLILKKSNSTINRRNKYLNYGLLSLATELKAHGYQSIQVQGNFDTPYETYTKCVELGLDSSNYPLLVSIPSFYAISWANEFIAIAKSINKNLKVVVGGRWVVNNNPKSFQRIVPKADFIIPGLANNFINKVVDSIFLKKKIPKNISLKNKIPTLDYTILHERHLYQPSIEISRGCGMGCSFCQEKNEKLQKLKNPECLIKELKQILINDNLTKMSPYFEASMFIPNSNWINELSHFKKDQFLNFKWRAEGRVDTIKPKYLSGLKKSGLTILDLGLESASPTQLYRMNKTRDAEKYLVKASELIKEAYFQNIMVKLNILLTPGETLKTLEETTKWLDIHGKYIKGVSVGPIIVFGLSSDTKSFMKEIKMYGATKHHSPTQGVTHINLSPDIDFEKSIELSTQISRNFMSAKDYFDLKSFSYFSRDYNYNSFLDDLRRNDDDYSFSISQIKAS